MSALPELDADDLGPDSARVFLSYSRKDRERAQRIADVLRERHFGVFRDTDDILPTEEWKGRLEQLIAEADTIVFLMSPQSVASEVCAWEVEYATELNKRIAPIVIEDVEADTIPPLLARLNFIFATERDRFQDAVDSLVSALNSDIDWIREHTRLAALARRWRDADRPTRLLLRGQDIADAEAWRDRRPREAPDVLSLQADFIAASRRAASRRQRMVASFSLAGLAVAVGLAGFALVQRQAAVENERIAQANEQLAIANEQAAEAARDVAVTERDRAQVSQSRMLTRLSVEQLAEGRPLDAALIALEGLPDPGNSDLLRAARPLVDDALVALKEGSRQITEIALLHAGRFLNRLTLSQDGRWLAVHDPKGGELTLIDLPARKVSRSLRAREIQGSGTVAFLPDGENVILPGSDGHIWQIGIADKSPVSKLAVPGLSIVLATPLGTSGNLAVLTSSGQVHLVPSNGGPPRSLGAARTFAASPDGARIAVLHEGQVRIHDASTGDRLHGPWPFLKGPLKFADQMAYAPNGSWLATWSENEFWLLNGETGRLEVKGGVRENSISRLRFSPDSSRMAAPGADGSSPIYELTARKLLARLPGGVGWMTDAVLTADNRRAVTVGMAGIPQIWDIARNAVLDTRLGHEGPVMTALLTPDETRLITSGEDGTVRLWQMPRPENTGPSAVEEYQGRPVYSPDGSLVALSEEGIFNVKTGERIARLHSPDRVWRYRRFLDNGHIFGLRVDYDDQGRESLSACTIDPTDPDTTRCFDNIANDGIWNADMDPKGRTVAIHQVREGQSMIRVVDGASGETIVTHPECPKDDERGCYSDPRVDASGDRVLLTRWGVQLHIFRRDTDKPTVRIQPDFPVTEIHTDPSRELALFWSAPDAQATVFDTGTGEKRFAFPLKKGVGSEIVFSPSGRYFASVTDQGLLELRDLAADGAVVLAPRPPGREWMVLPVFNKDEDMILTGREKALLAYDLKTGRNLAQIELDFGTHYPSVFARGFADGDKTIIGWTWDGPESFALLRDPARAVASVQAASSRCLTPDQRRDLYLAPEPPDWCITGAGLEGEDDPANWMPVWPYRAKAWRDWLVARRAGEESTLPK